MKGKVFLVIAVLFASLLMVTVEPVGAELPASAYNLTKYDPSDDVIRFRSGGDFKLVKSGDSHYSDAKNVDVVKMTSSYTENLGIGYIQLTMRVEGTIKNSDAYKYVFAVDADGDTYIFLAYWEGGAIGMKLGDITPRWYGTASGENTNTLTITFPISKLDSHDTSFDFTGGAVYSIGDYERYVDMAPDKLIYITEPSDGSTVEGGVTVKGVIRESVDSKPGTDVKISIDNGPAQDVTGDPWSFDTGPLDDGEHDIRVWVESAGVENNWDEITITVDSDTENYDHFSIMPELHLKDRFEYEALEDVQISGIELPLSTETTITITDITTIDVDGTNYEVIEMLNDGEGGEDFGFIWYENDMDKTQWRIQDSFEIVKEHTVADTDAPGRDPTHTEITTTYKPPYETHNGFSITVGFDDNRWYEDTTAYSESTTTVGDDTTDNPPYSESLHVTGECLYYLPSIEVFGEVFGDQEGIYVIRTYLENPGVSILEYYSPDLGMPVRIDTYDLSRNKLISLGLKDYGINPYSVMIEEVTFNPAKPKEDENCKITVKIKNVGGEAASSLQVTIMDGSKQVGQETITSLASGASEDLTVDWTPESEGNHTISISVSSGNNDLADKIVYVDVGPPGTDDTSDMPIIPLIILVIIVIVVVLAVVLLKRKGAAKGESAEAQPSEAEVEAAPEAAAAAAPVTVAAEGEAEPAAVAAPADQLITENIQCPSCKNAFTVQYESKPVRVKCPTCGTEGVLN